MGPDCQIYGPVNGRAHVPNLGHHQLQMMTSPEPDVAWDNGYPTEVQALPSVPYVNYFTQAAYTQYPGPTEIDHPPNNSENAPNAEWVARLNQQRKRGRGTGIVKRRKQAALEKRQTAPPSKAALKRAELIAQFGEENVASDGDVKGFTRPRAEGYLEWYDSSCDRYLPAAPHDTFRAEFIKIDEARYAPYQHEVESGYHELDVTSNCDINLQNTWEFTEDSFAQITDSNGNPVGMMNKRPKNEPRRPETEYLYHNGLIMLDQDDRPIFNWSDIPLCFSSRLEGGRMEALRRVFPWLKVSDFRARMPREVINEHGTPIPLASLSSLGQRMLRFRDSVGCRAWIDRTEEGSHKRKAILKRKRIEDTYQVTDIDEGKRSPRREVLAAAAAAAAIWSQSAANPSQPDIDPLLLSQPIPTVPFGEMSEQYEAIQGQQIAAQPPTPPPPAPPLLPLGPAPALPLVPTAPDPAVTFLPMAPAPGPTPLRYHPKVTSDIWYSPGGTSLLLDTDYRTMRPQTEAEEQHVRAAIRLTRADFATRHSFAPPPLSNGHSYNEHYNYLQKMHEARWFAGEPAPLLLGVESWGNSFSSWEAPALQAWQVKMMLVSVVFLQFN